jgi:hypothetical protein
VAERQAAALQAGGVDVGFCGGAFGFGIGSRLAKLAQSLKTLPGSHLLILELRQLGLETLELGDLFIAGLLGLLQRFSLSSELLLEVCFFLLPGIKPLFPDLPPSSR